MAGPRPSGRTRGRLPLAAALVVVLLAALGAASWVTFTGTVPAPIGRSGTATSASAPTNDSSADDSVGPAAGAAGTAAPGGFCQVVQRGVDDQTSGLDSDDPTAESEKNRALKHSLFAAAPSEIRSDLALVNGVTDQIAASHSSEASPREQLELMGRLMGPDYFAALQRIGTYSQEHCGAGLGG